MRAVAIIEQNSAARAELRNAVEDAGFRTDCFSDGEAALAMLRQRAFSLAIFDLDAGEEDAFVMCRDISRVVPLITVTRECDPDKCVRALEAGADDCVKRPLSPRELVARVKSVLRRTRRVPLSDDAEIDALSMSVSEMRVRSGDAVHELSRGEVQVLALLVEHAPTPLSPARIAEILGAKTSTIQSRIKSLRRKIGSSRLATRARLGYSLVKD